MTLVNLNKAFPKSFNLFDEFLNDFPTSYNRESSLNVPPVNILESNDAYHLEVNAPGRVKEDFKVAIEKGLLTISYEHKTEPAAEGVRSIRKEFSFKSFKRSFTLDDKIDAENIQAKYENGLLKFYLPKKEQAKEVVKQISIQ